MKLSKAQARVLEKATAEIDKARNNSFKEWCGDNWEYIDEFDGYREQLEKKYHNAKNNIVEIHCNSKTIAKLEDLGYIEIIYDSKNEKIGFDVIKVLNY